jgi:hypothetical protein
MLEHLSGELVFAALGSYPRGWNADWLRTLINTTAAALRSRATAATAAAGGVRWRRFSLSGLN